MRKKLMFLILILLSTVFICSCTSSKILYLELENTENIEVQLGEEYLHEGVKVYAVYSEDERENVTADAKFSDVDTSKVGEKVVIVTYKKEKATYKIKVVEPSEQELIVDATEAKSIYFIGERFSSSGIKLYKGNQDTKITNYTLEIKDAENHSINKTEDFTEAGVYQVELSVDEQKVSYPIVVVKEKPNGDGFNANALETKFSHNKGEFLIPNGTVLFSNAIASISVTGSVALQTKEVEHTNITQIFDNVSYTSRLALTKESKLVLDLQKDCDVLLIASGKSSCFEFQSKQKDPILSYGTLRDEPAYSYVNLPRGSYELSVNDLSYLNAISFLPTEGVSGKYRSLNIDTSVVKLNYKLGEPVALSGLKIYGVKDDGTSELLDFKDCIFSLWKGENEEKQLSSVGTYTVKIMYKDEMASTSYDIEVIQDSNTRFKEIHLDTSKVKTTFQQEPFVHSGLKVYGVTENELQILLNESDYTVSLSRSFSESGDYNVTVSYIGAISCLQPNATYTVHYIAASSSTEPTAFDSVTMNQESLKKIFIGEAFSSASFRVYAKKGNETTLIPATNYTVVLKNKNGDTVTSFTDNGLYQVEVHYTGEAQCTNATFTYAIEYYENDAAKVYKSISVDTTNAVLEYGSTEDTFTTSGLKVRANYACGAYEVLSEDDYEISLDFNGQPVNGFSEYGSYVVYVNYGGRNTMLQNSTHYQIRVVAPYAIVTFSYSGAGMQPEWVEHIDPKHCDPKDYIRTPDSSYAFMGFSEDITKFKIGSNSVVKVYVEKPASGKKRVTYLNYNGVISNQYRDLDMNTLIPTDITPEGTVPEGLRFYQYDIPQGAKITQNCYYFPLYIQNETSEIQPVVQIDSSTQVSIYTSGQRNEVYSCDLTVMEDGNIFLEGEALPLVATHLNSMTSYKITGTLLKRSGYVLQENQIKETVFTTSVYESFESMDTTEAVDMVAANCFNANIDSFIEHTPNGYALTGFLVCDEYGNEVQDILYTPEMESLFVTGLENDTSYQVIAYYDAIQLQPAALFSMRRAKSNGLTYRFHFVGFFIQTKGEITYRVRMMYQDQVLYTWYVAKGDSVYNPYAFVLPIEYEDYIKAGSLERLENVDKDIDCEVILIPKQEESPYTVIFYDTNINGHNPIIDMQSVPSGGSAVAPANPESYYSADGGYRYIFSGWSKEFTNITETTYVYAQYTRYTLAAPTCRISNLDIYPEEMKLTLSLYYIDTILNMKIYLMDSLGNQIEFEEANLSTYMYIYGRNFAADTAYTLCVDITYELMDDQGPQILSKTLELKTLEANAALDVQMEFTDIKYNQAKAMISGSDEIDKIYYKTEGYSYSDSTVHKYNGSIYAYVSASYQNREYIVQYATKDETNDNVYHIYSPEFTVTTAPAEQPTITGCIEIEEKDQSSILILSGTNPDEVEIFVRVRYQNSDFDYSQDSNEYLFHDFYSPFSYDPQLDRYCVIFEGLWPRIPAYDLNGNVVDYYQYCYSEIEISYFYDGEEYYYWFSNINGQEMIENQLHNYFFANN